MLSSNQALCDSATLSDAGGYFLLPIQKNHRLLLQNLLQQFELQHSWRSDSRRGGTSDHFNLKTRMALVRFWYRGTLVGQQEIEAEGFKKV